ncbi:hypothetical protein LTS18_005164 [Coniosporium uncinatum]|uniref:Uncharacterized protein n=1 Tax=Coniosporium uncinatum TaxID=93489 RepID=A0ACC3DBE2_9PEZI|nr:hypothetical protein LTS18_005164 [Coniosporium uncinatum]
MAQHDDIPSRDEQAFRFSSAPIESFRPYTHPAKHLTHFRRAFYNREQVANDICYHDDRTHANRTFSHCSRGQCNGRGHHRPLPTAVAPTAPDNFTLVALLVLLSLAVAIAMVYGIVHLCRHIRQQRATLVSETRNEQTPSGAGRLHSAPMRASQSPTAYHRSAESPVLSHVRRYRVAPTAPPARPESVHLQDRNVHDHSGSADTVLPFGNNGPQATGSPAQPWPQSHFSVSSGSLGEVPSGWVTVDTPARTTHQAFDDAFI